MCHSTFDGDVATPPSEFPMIFHGGGCRHNVLESHTEKRKHTKCLMLIPMLQYFLFRKLSGKYFGVSILVFHIIHILNIDLEVDCIAIEAIMGSHFQ